MNVVENDLSHSGIVILTSNQRQNVSLLSNIQERKVISMLRCSQCLSIVDSTRLIKQLNTIVNMFALRKVVGLISAVSERSLQQVKIGYIFSRYERSDVIREHESLVTTLFGIRNTIIC